MNIVSLIARVVAGNEGTDPTGNPGDFGTDLDRIREGERETVVDGATIQVQPGPDNQGRFNTPPLTFYTNSTFNGIQQAPNNIGVDGSGNTLVGGDIGFSDRDSPIQNSLTVRGADNRLVAGDAGTYMRSEDYVTEGERLNAPASGNQFIGGKGADYIVPSAEDAVVSGGAGDDTVKLSYNQGFTGSPAEVVAQLAKFQTFDGGEGSDTLLLPGNTSANPVTPEIKQAYVQELVKAGLWDNFETIKWEGGPYDEEIRLK